ncbi:uncharacterized protein si:dkeyp-97b10.3 [Clupea harengus]|uniref:Uncharacterized protein si:dkeyp-97b10.3 n=1 Tax=Clupea harengus TaxID=7950 RepID=A0A8M1KPY0_CLUHA|nr:uncharacterized protein si:dkeyp-97b10.3 [Clupea harengus]
MVAEMISFGDNTNLEEGDEKVLPPDQKDSPPESENSASEVSTEGSSSEQEEEEEEEEDRGANDTHHGKHRGSLGPNDETGTVPNVQVSMARYFCV